MATMTAQAVVDWIVNGSKGKFFSVDFTKRTTGEQRHMTCRYGVRNRVTGAGRTYEFEDHALICVFDTVKNNYRTIPAENLISIKIDGVLYEVTYDGRLPEVPSGS